ncbi:MAG: hypothetical protein M3Z26_10515 [Bacteroidota bacterium]|nr:hypothetical protein [Bacteroidota bacterium]
MIVEENTSTQGQLYYRLITLWVISESVAGGIIHGLHLPFSGMFLSGFAVLCICLIGYYQGDRKDGEPSANQRLSKKGAILKATIIVCIFKMTLSPNTPPSAYFAVLFQGFMGQILFINLKHFKFSCILLGFLALIESAAQRIIVLVLLYGSGFWNAVNEFITKLTHAKVITNYSMMLAIAYIAIHGIFGILIGMWAYSLVHKSQFWKDTQPHLLIAESGTASQFKPRTSLPKKRKIVRSIFIFIWILLLLFFFQSLFKIGKPVLPSSKALQIILRSSLIFLTWYSLASPLITGFIKKKLQNQKEKSTKDINRILLLLPSTENIFRKSWQLSSSRVGVKRIGFFWKIVLMNVLRDG